VNNLSGGLAGDGPVHLVLNSFEKEDANLLGGVVIDTRGVNVSDLLVEPPLGSSDILNPAHKLFEIVEGLIGILQTFIVHREALHDVFTQPLRGPDAEAGGHHAFNPVADRNDGIEVVAIHPSLDRAPAFLANRQEILVSCLSL